MTPHIKTTYEIVTPESAEQGDCAERGFVGIDGAPVECKAIQGDVDEVGAAVYFLKNSGPLEPSSSHFHPGVWYTQSDPRQDRAFFERGEDYRESYHLYEFTEAQEREIFERLTGRGGK